MGIMRVVVDTNVLVSAFLKPDTAPRQVLRACLCGEFQPVVSNSLFVEYTDVLFRPHLLERYVVSRNELDTVFDALMSVSDWVQIAYMWRPNLKDEADNHVVEACIAGNAQFIVTGNRADFSNPELLFDSFRVVAPAALMEMGV